VPTSAQLSAMTAPHKTGSPPACIYENFSAGLAPYTLTDGLISQFNTVTVPYGSTEGIELEASTTVADISRSFGPKTSARYLSAKFQITSLGTADAGILNWTSSGSAICSINPRKALASDSQQRVHASLGGTDVAVSPSAISVNTWYELDIQINPSLNGSTYVLTQLPSTVIQSGDFPGTFSAAVVDGIHFSIDASGGPTSSTTQFADTSVCTVAGDPYIAQVVLLMGFENGAGTTYVDESPANETVTGVTGAVISTTSPLVQSGSLDLNGIADARLNISTTPNFGFGTAPWTWEATIYIRAFSGSDGNNVPIYDFRPDQFYDGAMFVSGATQIIEYYNGTSSVRNTSGTVIELNTPYRVALSYDGSKMYGFVEGVLQFATTFAVNFGTTNLLKIGTNYYLGDGLDMTNGKLDELRITKGVCRYTASYTPTTGPFPRS
jgi:hypothetical protein